MKGIVLTRGNAEFWEKYHDIAYEISTGCHGHCVAPTLRKLETAMQKLRAGDNLILNTRTQTVVSARKFINMRFPHNQIHPYLVVANYDDETWVIMIGTPYDCVEAIKEHIDTFSA